MKTSDSSGAFARTNAKHWDGVEADDIPPGWMDDMVRRLFDILNRDMIRLEQAQICESDKKGPDGKPPPLDFEKTQKHTRLLHQMQSSLERLREMEDRNAKKRKPKVKMSDEQALQELERRIDQLVAARDVPKRSEESET